MRLDLTYALAPNDEVEPVTLEMQQMGAAVIEALRESYSDYGLAAAVYIAMELERRAGTAP